MPMINLLGFKQIVLAWARIGTQVWLRMNHLVSFISKLSRAPAENRFARASLSLDLRFKPRLRVVVRQGFGILGGT